MNLYSFARFFNVVGNALKFTEKGHVKLSFASPGTYRLKGHAPGTVRSNRVKVKVGAAH